MDEACYFDLAAPGGDGEYPIVSAEPFREQHYADNFYEFLEKRIAFHE